MLRVALLYGDAVTLHSPIAALLMSATERATSFTTVERLSLMVRLAPLSNPDVEANYRHQLESFEEISLKEKKLLVLRAHLEDAGHQVPQIVEALLEAIGKVKKLIEDKGQSQWFKLDRSIDEIRAGFGLDKLHRALKTGRLQVNNMQTNKVDGYELLFRLGRGEDIRHKDIQHLVEKPTTEMAQEVMNLMFSPNKLYPFVDSKFGEAFRLAGHMSNTMPPLNQVQASKAKNVSLVSQLFELLPDFEKASFDEVLSINDELSSALTRFRGAVGEYAELIESTSWDSDFEAEAAKVFEEKIKPAVKEIEERVDENSYLCQLTSQVKESTVRNLIGVGVASSALNRIDFQVAALTALGLLSFDFIWAARKKLAETRVIEREKLFFYYKLSERFKT